MNTKPHFRISVVLLLAVSGLTAQNLSIERLFSRPYLWGTWPSQIAWAKHAPVLGFLWNAKGGAFRDLYVYHADTRKLTRLTSLEGVKDPINDSEAETDIHRKQYLPPPSGLGGFQLSADGARAVFTYRGDLFLASVASGALQRLTKTKAAESNPVFSEDGARIAYSTNGQLFVMRPDGGLVEQKTDIKPPASLEGFHWSPDGRYLAYLVKSKPQRKMPLPLYSGQFVTASPFERSVAGDPAEEEQLFVVESEGDAPSRLIDFGSKPNPIRMPEWSPDSSRLLSVNAGPDFKSQEIRVASVTSGQSIVIFQQKDDRWMEYSDAGWDQQSQRLWFTSDQSGFQHLYVVDRDGAHQRQLTQGPWEVHSDTFSHAPEWIGKYIYYSSTQKNTAERQFYRVKADDPSTSELLSTREGLTIGWISQDGSKRATLEADSENPFDLFVDGERVTKSPLPEFYQLPWAQTRYVTYPSLRDKKPVTARLLLPPGYNPDGAKQSLRPAILYIHGSGYATSVLKQWGSYQDLRFAFNNYLASQGFVILEMDYRGSTGYGRDWRSGVYLNMGGPDLEDVLGGVEYLRSLKNIDSKRLGIWGWSYGGFMTATALFKAPGTFKAGAAFSGVYDWLNYNSGYTGERLTTPAQNPEAYRRSSPIHFSQQLQDRLLIVHGIADNNVLFQDAVQLSEKLIHEGNRFEESFYPEESHAYLRDESLKDAFGKTAEFFSRYLTP